MHNTPNANRKHIGIYGNTNSGKSSLMNKLLNQDISLVSEVAGTTTNPVQKAMELLPFGPILLLDTAGLDDKSNLGKALVDKSINYLNRLDMAIYVVDGLKPDISSYNLWKTKAKKYNLDHIVVINKEDMLTNKDKLMLEKTFHSKVFVSVKNNQNIECLKDIMVDRLTKQEVDKPLVGDLLKYGSKVILVISIDSEAPKGRLILPQVQVIRDCLDHGIMTYVVRETELEYAIKDIKDVDLVITDSQLFKEVDKIVPNHIKLTSFSILFARQKGILKDFLYGAKCVDKLNTNSKVLICESCSHNISHEDIGKVKIPNILRKIANGNLHIDFKTGYDFVADVSNYDLVIHCGGCMVNRKSILNKIYECNSKKVPITNYGLLISHYLGILNRSIEIFS